MNMKKTGVMSFVLLLMGLFLFACTQPPTHTQRGVPSSDESLASFEGIKKFTSHTELLAYLQKSQSMGSDYYYGGVGMAREMMSVSFSSAPMAKAMSMDSAVSESAAGSPSPSNGGSSDYSSTNIQVEGVDEADFVKNDGEYIYTLVQNKLVIVKAYPADESEVVFEQEFEGSPRNLLLNGKRLAVIIDDSLITKALPRFGVIPEDRYIQQTRVKIFDVSDMKNAREVKDYSIDGYYMQSRMIGEHIYLVASEGAYYYGDSIMTPSIREGSQKIATPEIYYFDNPEGSYQFNTVAAIDILSDEDSVAAQTFMMGYASTIYVSQDNLYIAYQKNLPWNYWQDEQERRFYDIAVPILPSDVRNTIESIKDDSSLDSLEQWEKISDALTEMYGSMSEDEAQDLQERIQEAIDEHDVLLQQERQKTIVHRIAIDDGVITYGAQGEVPGYLLNQFSMDEHDNKLRLATTSDYWTRERSVQYNNIYVLDSDMDTIGKLEGLAADERIYSARFIGERLYLVTFKRIDPFFVIDLSSDEPKVLGELKIPGYSDYLHPYDENHIIGIGKDTKENDWGGISTTGIKIALFDVSDVSNPTVLDTYKIGEEGTESEALSDHKAFLFDREKNLLVLPIREVTGKPYFDSKLRYYKQRVWQGAYALDVSIDDISLKGKITHSEDAEDQWWYYGAPNAVRRALYMDDALYTISQKKIMAHSLSDLDSELASIELPYEEPKPYPIEPYPYRGEEAMQDLAVESIE